MADLQFNEEQEFFRPAPVSKPSFLTGLVLKTGVVQTERDAGYVLLGIAVLCTIAAVYVFFSSTGSPTPPPSPFMQEAAAPQYD